MRFNLATLAGLQASRRYWKTVKLPYRKRRHDWYHRLSKRPESERARLAAKWHRLVEEAERIIYLRERAIAKRTKGRIKAGGANRGTKGVVDSLRSIGGEGLTVTSTKRQNTNPFSGRGSDHDYRNTDAWANDLSNGSSPTPQMDRAAERIMRAIGFKSYRAGQAINVNQGVTTIKAGRGLYRVQVIYRGAGPSFGGNHLNHIHVGVKRVG